MTAGSPFTPDLPDEPLILAQDSREASWFSWPGSVGYARRRAPDECSWRPAGSAIEPKRTGMVRREGRERDRGTSGRGGPGVLSGLRRAAGPDRRHFVLVWEMCLLSNRGSARPGAVPVTEINSHLGNPG